MRNFLANLFSTDTTTVECNLTTTDRVERYSVTEYGRVLFTTDDLAEAKRSLRIFVGAEIVDTIA